MDWLALRRVAASFACCYLQGLEPVTVPGLAFGGSYAGLRVSESFDVHRPHLVPHRDSIGRQSSDCPYLSIPYLEFNDRHWIGCADSGRRRPTDRPGDYPGGTIAQVQNLDLIRSTVRAPWMRWAAEVTTRASASCETHAASTMAVVTQLPKPPTLVASPTDGLSTCRAPA